VNDLRQLTSLADVIIPRFSPSENITHDPQSLPSKFKTSEMLKDCVSTATNSQPFLLEFLKYNKPYKRGVYTYE
jgi:hypothetical protein